MWRDNDSYATEWSYRQLDELKMAPESDGFEYNLSLQNTVNNKSHLPRTLDFLNTQICFRLENNLPFQDRIKRKSHLVGTLDFSDAQVTPYGLDCVHGKPPYQ